MKWIDAALFMSLVSIVSTTEVHADDTYNFYFQKGQAPQSVNQGSSGPSVPEPPTVPQPEPEAKTTAAAEPEEVILDPLKRFQFQLGYTTLEDDVGRAHAFSVGGQLNFNKYLGLRLQGRLMAPGSDDFSETSWSEKQKQQIAANSDDSNYRVGGLGAIAFTPLSMNLVGHHFLEFSVLGGVHTAREVKQVDDELRIKKTYQPVAGASAYLALNENAGAEIQGLFDSHGNFGQVTGSLAFRF